MDGYWDTYAWALMGNHFHFLVAVKSKKVLAEQAAQDFKKIGRLFYKHHQLELHVLVGQHLPGFENLVGVREAGVREAVWNASFDLPNEISFKQLLELAELHNQELHNKMLSWIISERFRLFLMGYAKAINKQQNRTGSLFQDRFKSKWIGEVQSAKTVLQYIHHNPIHHDCAVYYDQYPWTSFLDYVEGKTDVGLHWYGDIETFKREHETYREEAINRADDEGMEFEGF